MSHQGILLCLLLTSAATDAQESTHEISAFRVEAGLDTAVATLGSPLNFYLRLTYPSGYQLVLPDLGQILPEGIVRESGPQSSAVSPPASTVLTYRVHVFKLGEMNVPPLPVLFAGAEGDTVLRVTAPVPLKVVAVREADDNELRDIAPPLVIVGGMPVWAAILAAALMAIMVAWLLKRLFLDRHRTEPSPLPIPSINYESEFKKIGEMRLVARGAYKTHYTMLSETLRRFFEDEVGIETLEQTTEELANVLGQLQPSLARETESKIVAFLQAADLVKFAKHVPEATDAEVGPQRGIEIIRDVQVWLSERERLRERETVQTTVVTASNLDDNTGQPQPVVRGG